MRKENREYIVGDRVIWTDPETNIKYGDATIVDITGDLICLSFPNGTECECFANELQLTIPYDKYDYSEFAESVMEKITQTLKDWKFEIDAGDGCVYFNDEDLKMTYRIQLERCPIYAN